MRDEIWSGSSPLEVDSFSKFAMASSNELFSCRASEKENHGCLSNGESIEAHTSTQKVNEALHVTTTHSSAAEFCFRCLFAKVNNISATQSRLVHMARFEEPAYF